MKTKTLAVALTLSLALAAGAYATRSAVPLIEPARIELAASSANADVEAVKNAIVVGGAVLNWTVVSSEPGKLRLQFSKQGKHIVVVDATYDATGYQLKYVSSTNMKYEETDGPVIHPFYNKWVDNLIHSIGKAYPNQ